MTAWEYLIVTLTVEEAKERDLQADLNALGSRGWELVTIEMDARGRAFFFKRPAQD
jgi:hypothetical protein